MATVWVDFKFSDDILASIYSLARLGIARREASAIGLTETRETEASNTQFGFVGCPAQAKDLLLALADYGLSGFVVDIEAGDQHYFNGLGIDPDIVIT